VSTTGSGRRADVVQLAGELFAQKGYRATTVREIAEQLERGKREGTFGGITANG